MADTMSLESKPCLQYINRSSTTAAQCCLALSGRPPHSCPAVPSCPARPPAHHNMHSVHSARGPHLLAVALLGVALALLAVEGLLLSLAGAIACNKGRERGPTAQPMSSSTHTSAQRYNQQEPSIKPRRIRPPNQMGPSLTSGGSRLVVAAQPIAVPYASSNLVTHQHSTAIPSPELATDSS